jgi:hypothetical protein
MSNHAMRIFSSLFKEQIVKRLESGEARRRVFQFNYKIIMYNMKIERNFALMPLKSLKPHSKCALAAAVYPRVNRRLAQPSRSMRSAQ